MSNIKGMNIQRAALKKNVSAMYALQIANYILPIITLPYLIRTLGSDGYGQLAFAYSLVYLMVLFVDTGFNTRAAHALSKPDISTQDASRIYAATIWFKVLQTIFVFSILLILINTIPALNNASALYLVSFMTVIGSLIFPVWLYQGLEIMHFTTICSVGGRLITTILIFALVKEPSDIVLAAFLQASGTALSGLLSLPIIFSKLKLTIFYSFTSLKPDLIRAWEESKTLGISEYVTNALENSGVFILGLFTSDAVTGIYAAIEKLARALLSVFQPLIKALFPYLSGKWSSDINIAQADAKKWSKRLSFTVVLISIFTAIFSEFGLTILFGDTWGQHSSLLQLFCLWLIFAVMSASLGQLWLLASGEKILYSKVLLVSSLVQLIAAVWLTFQFSMYGMASALLVTEVIKLILFAYAINKWKLRMQTCVY